MTHHIWIHLDCTLFFSVSNLKYFQGNMHKQCSDLLLKTKENVTGTEQRRLCNSILDRLYCTTLPQI